MKNLDELTLHFPEMDQKRKESLLGGGYGAENGKDDPINGGQYGSGVTIIGYYTSAPSSYPTPRFGSGGTGSEEGGGGGSSSGTPSAPVGTPLHPEIVAHLLTTLKFDSTFSAAEKAEFENTIKAIDSSQAGDKMLTALDNYYKTNPNATVPLITSKTNNIGAQAQFVSGNGKAEYDMGDLFKSGRDLSWQVDILSHEMYHNYQFVSGQNMKTLNTEVDAYLFSSLVDKQANASDFAMVMATAAESKNPTTQAQRDFDAAWEQYVKYNDGSQSVYNAIVNNFINGSAPGMNYSNLSNATNTNEPQFLKDLQLAFPQGSGDTGGNPSNPNPYQ